MTILPRRSLAGGASDFLSLTDTPSSYVSQARKRLRVNSTETAIEFYLSSIINVKDYGAIGDGATDDTAAILAAIAAFGTYRRLFFPAGVYIVNSQLTIALANATVFGEGRFASVIKLKNSSSITAGQSILLLSAAGITVEDIGIDGNSPNNPTVNVSGIRASANDFQVLNCMTQKLTLYGIVLDGGTAGLNRFRVENNDISDIGFRGIATIHAKDGLISGNTIVSTGSHAIDIQRGSIWGTHNCERLRIIGNYVTRAVPPVVISPLIGGVQDGGLLALDLGAKFITVDGNILWNNLTGGDDGIILGQDGTNDPTDIVITDNIVGYTGNFGIDATTRSVIDGNYIYKSGAHGIVAVIDMGGTLADIIISNNLIIDPSDDGMGNPGGIVSYSLIGGAQIKNLKITGNTVKSSNGLCAHGIRLDSTNVTYTDIEIKNNNLKTIVTQSVNLIGTNYANLVVKDNLEKTPIHTLSVNSATPSVLGGDTFITANTSPTTLTSFANGYDSQRIRVIIGDANTTLNSTGNIVAATTAPSQNDCMDYIYSATTTKWHEVK